MTRDPWNCENWVTGIRKMSEISIEWKNKKDVSEGQQSDFLLCTCGKEEK